jgi:ADP-L-glycero-D-manno-heptose 6-epimerase
LIYASSAATYGGGELGYKDDHELAFNVKPLNPYGKSKNEFDKWALQQEEQPPSWVGLKFFNVYGPNEYHKERMASMVFHGYNQIKKTGKMKLFRSHREDFKDGEQLRDFIYVEDIAKLCHWLTENKIQSGLYNVGTGKARSFNDLAKAVSKAMGKKATIEYIDIPEDIRDKYQYFTEADMTKLINAGYENSFYTLEDGINDYVKSYLQTNSYY